MLRLEARGVTDVGRKRKQNQDAFVVVPELGFFVVADGLGGHASGEVASWESVDVMHAWVLKHRELLPRLAADPDDPDLLDEARSMLEAAVKAATYHVFGLAQIDTTRHGMGTTISAMCVAGDVALIAQVGDSRVYRARNGKLRQLTDDHTLVAMQVRDGVITPEQAATSKHRNVITRAVGSHEYVEVDTSAVTILPGDVFLLCTDGLHGYLKEDEALEHLNLEPGEAAQSLVDLANSRGGKDNVTALVVRFFED